MTLADVRDAVVRCCEDGYRLTDEECGISRIREEDVTEDVFGVFVARFRLSPDKRAALESMATYACSEVFKCERRLFVARHMEWGIPYLECAWVIEPFSAHD